jgi:hypothetical protein
VKDLLTVSEGERFAYRSKQVSDLPAVSKVKDLPLATGKKTNLPIVTGKRLTYR